MLYRIIVWVRPDGSYYHRFIKGFYKKYYVGYKNQYKHCVVYIIDDIHVITYTFTDKLKHFIKVLLRFFITFLDKLYEKL